MCSWGILIIASGEEIRLADVNTPERYETGYYEATEFLENLIYDKPVFLYFGNYDKYGRLVCLVYAIYNDTYYVNINEILVTYRYATIWDHSDNGFDPYTWPRVIDKPSFNARLSWLGLSTIIGIILTYVTYRILYDIMKFITTILYRLRVQSKKLG